MEHEEAKELFELIATAGSPEEAARLGRSAQRSKPHLVRPSWDDAKLTVMYLALRDKVRSFFP